MVLVKALLLDHFAILVRFVIDRFYAIEVGKTHGDGDRIHVLCSTVLRGRGIIPNFFQSDSSVKLVARVDVLHDLRDYLVDILRGESITDVDVRVPLVQVVQANAALASQRFHLVREVASDLRHVMRRIDSDNVRPVLNRHDVFLLGFEQPVVGSLQAYICIWVPSTFFLEYLQSTDFSFEILEILYFNA